MPSERRLHPLAIVFDIGRQIGALAVPLLLLVFGLGSGGFGSEGIALVLLLPYAGVAIGRYVSFRYRYEAKDLVVRSGLIFRNERHIPYDRIQNIDAVQNVLHRLFGVVEVRVQTGSGNEAEATLSAVPLGALEEMRTRVFSGREARAGAPADAPAIGDAPPDAAAAPPPARALLQLDARELGLYGLIENRGLIVIAAAFGLLWEAGASGGAIERLLGDETAARGAIRSILRMAGGRAELSTGAVLAVPAAVLAFLLVSRVFSVAWALVKLHGFRLTRAGEDLRTAYGLLTRVTATVPLRRIQTVTVREGPLHRLFGRASVRVSTAGGVGAEQAQSQREWLAPVIRRDAVPALLGEILPGVDVSAVAWEPVHSRAFRRAIKGRMTGAAILTAIAVWMFGRAGLLVAPVAVAWAVLAARLYVRHLGWAVSGDAVLFRRGVLSRFVTVALVAKIQAVELAESPFDRRTAMARLRVDTAGAGEGFKVDIPFLPLHRARELGRRLATEAAETSFRW
jgi:putative membrane protein